MTDYLGGVTVKAFKDIGEGVRDRGRSHTLHGQGSYCRAYKRLAQCQAQKSESHSVTSDSLRFHGLYSPWILQARILEWVAFPFSRGSSQPRSPALQEDFFFFFFKSAEPQGKPKHRTDTEQIKVCGKTMTGQRPFFSKSHPHPRLLELSFPGSIPNLLLEWPLLTLHWIFFLFPSLNGDYSSAFLPQPSFCPCAPPPLVLYGTLNPQQQDQGERNEAKLGAGGYALQKPQ